MYVLHTYTHTHIYQNQLTPLHYAAEYIYILLLPIYVYMFIASALALANSYIPIYVFVCVCVCVCVHICIYIYQNHHNLSTPLDLAVKKKKTEATAVLRAHGALHSLHFAAKKGMADEVAAGIAAGQDVNARDTVILLCGCMCGWVEVGGWSIM